MRARLGSLPTGRRRTTQASTAALAALTLLGALILGLAPGVLTLSATLGLLAVGIAAFAARLMREALGRVWARASADPRRDAAAPPPATGVNLRWSRRLFYLGALTVGLASFNVGFGLTFSQFAFLLALGGALFAVLRGHGIPLLPTALIVGTATFAFGGVISSFGAPLPGRSAGEVPQAIYVMGLWGFAAAMVLRTRRQVLTALTLWTVSIAIDGAGAIAQVAGSDWLVGPLEGNRATAFLPHPNDLGGACGIALIPALLLATARVPEWRRPATALRWLVVALIAAGVVLSASVAGMATAAVAVVIWLSSPLVRTPTRAAVLAALGVAMVAVLLIGGDDVTSPGERLKQVTSASGSGPEAGSGEERIKIVETVWPRIVENPLVGTGLADGGEPVTITANGQTRPYQAHGAPLAAWYEAGIAGLVGLLLVFGSLARTGWRSLRAARNRLDLQVGWALLAGFGAFVVWSMTVPFVFQQYAWFSAVAVLAWGLRRDAAPAPKSAPAWARGGQAVALRAPQPAGR